MIRSIADLGEEPEASSAHIGRRRVEQCAMISERNMVQVVMGVVSVEGAPPAISALHAHHPFGRAVDSPAIPRGIEAIEGEGHSSRVVEIGIVWVLVLERPAA